MFATDWLMCLYTRHLPFNTLLRVWDLFFCYGRTQCMPQKHRVVIRCLHPIRLSFHPSSHPTWSLPHCQGSESASLSQPVCCHDGFSQA